MVRTPSSILGDVAQEDSFYGSGKVGVWGVRPHPGLGSWACRAQRNRVNDQFFLMHAFITMELASISKGPQPHPQDKFQNEIFTSSSGTPGQAFCHTKLMSTYWAFNL